MNQQSQDKLIISASRRTDIPALYSSWFMNRIDAGWCLVPNPMNYNQLSYVSLKPDSVDAIVFWSKNPAPIIKHLDELDARGFHYYFQFALNDYPVEIEPNIPPLEERIDTFRMISQRVGRRRIVWRYDPIIISNKTSTMYHLDRFSKISKMLHGLTSRVMISLVDYYQKTERRLSSLENDGFYFERDMAYSENVELLLKDMAAMTAQLDMEIFTCAEERDYSSFGIPPGSCINGDLLYKLWSLPRHFKRIQHSGHLVYAQ